MAVIVHASSFTIGAKGGNQHNVAIKLSNGLIRNGHLVLNFSERDVARASSLFGHRRLGRAAVNRALFEFCRRHRPDLLLLGHADMIEPGTLSEIRAAVPKIRIAQWSVDALFELDALARVKARRRYVDATLVSTGGAALDPLRTDGHRVGFLPNPVDASIERGRNYLLSELPFDLFYGCGHPNRPPRRICGKDWNMDEFMAALVAEIPQLRLSVAGLLGKPRLKGAAYQDALEHVALGLNVSRFADWPLYSSDRLAQMIGNGLAIVIERATGYDSLFDEDEMLFFSSFDELVAKIRRAVTDPSYRQAVAAAGYGKYCRMFNERIIGRYIVDFAFGDADERAYGWPAGLI